MQTKPQTNIQDSHADRIEYAPEVLLKMFLVLIQPARFNLFLFI